MSGSKRTKMPRSTNSHLDHVSRKTRWSRSSSRADLQGTGTKVVYGSAVIEAVPPTPEQITRNVMEGRRAMDRLAEQLVRPGVDLVVAGDIPLYHADPARPGRLIRVMNGREDHGVFRNGVFHTQE